MGVRMHALDGAGLPRVLSSPDYNTGVYRRSVQANRSTLECPGYMVFITQT